MSSGVVRALKNVLNHRGLYSNWVVNECREEMELDQKAKGLKLEEEKEDVNGSLQTRFFPQLFSFG